MAAKKSESTVKISGAVRHGGQVYVPGDEDKLAKKLKEDGLDAVRGFGVDSTDRGTKAVRNDSERARIAARKQQAEAEANGESTGSESTDTDYTSVPLADLASALEAVNDKKTLQSLKRKDKRSGSKSIYAARLEAIQGAAESGETDAPDDGTEEE